MGSGQVCQEGPALTKDPPETRVGWTGGSAGENQIKSPAEGFNLVLELLGAASFVSGHHVSENEEESLGDEVFS